MSSSTDPQVAGSDWGAVALRLVEVVAVRVERVRPGMALSSSCFWFMRRDALVAVVPRDEEVDADRVLSESNDRTRRT